MKFFIVHCEFELGNALFVRFLGKFLKKIDRTCIWKFPSRHSITNRYLGTGRASSKHTRSFPSFSIVASSSARCQFVLFPYLRRDNFNVTIDGHKYFSRLDTTINGDSDTDRSRRYLRSDRVYFFTMATRQDVLIGTKNRACIRK